MRHMIDGIQFGEVSTREEAFANANELSATELTLSYFNAIVKAERTETYRRINRKWYADDPKRGYLAVVGRGKRAGHLRRDASNKLIILER